MNARIFARWLFWIAAFNAAIVLPHLGRTTLWNVDEARIAEISREMVESGDWIVPRIGGVAFAAYPPLQNWLLALSGLAFGWNEFAMRLPTALAGIALVVVCGLMARRLAGEMAGLAAALVLASLQGFVVQQAMARADVLVTLFATIAFDRFLVIAGGDRRARQLVLFHLSIALGILAKGPLAMVIPGMGIIGWLALHRRWSVLADLKPWAGLPLTLAIAAPWYVAVWRAEGWAFLHQNLMAENVQAFVTGYHQRRPAWQYLVWSLSRLWPWIIVLPLAWRVRRMPGLPVALAWLGGVFLFLCVSSAKRPNYLTFLHPAFAVSVGIALAALWEEAPKLLRGTLYGLGGLMTAAFILALFPLPWKGGEVRLTTHLMPAIAAAGIVCAAILIFVTWRRGARAGSVALAMIAGVAWTLFAAVTDPATDVEGPRIVEFCRRARAAVPPSGRIHTRDPRSVEAMYHFYVGHAMVRRDSGPGHFMVNDEDLGRLPAAERLLSFIDHRGRNLHLVRVP